MLMGGNSAPAVKRAARFGMGILTQGGDPRMEEVYREECARLGVEPGMCINPAAGTVTSAFVAKDPDAAWQTHGSYLLHDAQMYAEWFGDGVGSATKSVAASVDELRAEQGPYRIFSPAEAVTHIRENGMLLLQPLCGGLPPDLAWESLETMKSEVLPSLTSGSG